MNTAMRITFITAEDLDRVIDFGESLQNDERAYEPLLTFNREESHQHYTNELSNPDALIIVAKLENGTIVGYQYSHIRTLDYLSSNNQECVLEALYVDPQFRGQGIGKALATYAQDWAITEKKVNRLITHIYSKNEASMRLHTTDGFQPYNVELIKYV